jgi:hypothetical protein
MQLINKSDLLAPGVCVLCESSPSDGVKIVDTLKDLITGFPFHLEGRKYVCESCAKAVGAVIGLTSDDAKVEAERQRDLAEARLTALSGYLNGISEEIKSGKIDNIVATAEVPEEDRKSGLEAAVENGTDPGAVSIAGAAAPAEADTQPVTAAEVDASRLDGNVEESFDPSLTTEAPKKVKDKTPEPTAAISDAEAAKASADTPIAEDTSPVVKPSATEGEKTAAKKEKANG